MANTEKRSKSHSLAELLLKRTTETLQAASRNLTEDSPAGAFARGQVFEIAGYFDQAAESYREAGTDEAAARLAIVHIKNSKPEYALNTAMQLAARNPKVSVRELTSNESAGALTILGDALASNNRPEDAVKAYMAARKIDSKDSFAAGRLAQVYLALGQPAKAVELGDQFANNARFRSLSSVLALGKTNDALLPTIKTENLARVLRVSAPGRPMLLDGEPQLAAILEGSTDWCTPVAEDEC
ncbi:MAG TPA: hypothetical protein VLB46_15495 [Pyrinomonadaceae bacterium]|nr:hypothetical protein [Pyrinomonadaceae bacterium]